MANCTKCGSPLKPGAKFCTKCGTPVAQKASALFVPNKEQLKYRLI